MGAMRFTWYELRTLDLDAAAAFYGDVLGWRLRPAAAGGLFCAGDVPVASLCALPERARAAGAPAHWLAEIGVPDVDAYRERLLAQGAEPRGPVRRDGDGAVCSLRDPQGAGVGLCDRPGSPSPAVAWHELHVPDPARALAVYGELFGWRQTGALELPEPLGTYRTFGWAGDAPDDTGASAALAPSVGGALSNARRPEVHAQWLLCFATTDLDRAAQRVQALGGLVVQGPVTFPGGPRLVVCDDPQGAAFALRGA